MVRDIVFLGYSVGRGGLFLCLILGGEWGVVMVCVCARGVLFRVVLFLGNIG